MVLKLISWNVNGLNAAYKKGFTKFIDKEKADVYCLQETKGSEKTIPKAAYSIPGYERYWYQAERKGYSGVMALCKHDLKPISITKGINDEETDNEGRVLTLEFENFFLINAYFVNSGRGLNRLDLKMRFNDKFLKFCNTLREKKSLVICGDFNVAHTELDIAHPKSNENNAGFTKQERDFFTKFLNNGYVDTFRMFVKDGGHYTWWSYMSHARERDIGWRLDYFVVSENIKDKVRSSKILSNVMGSDHCPILLEIDL
ncbi:MAG: exodeoxyribonuclease III [Promethearchaeota archaeon]